MFPRVEPIQNGRTGKIDSGAYVRPKGEEEFDTLADALEHTPIGFSSSHTLMSREDIHRRSEDVF